MIDDKVMVKLINIKDSEAEEASEAEQHAVCMQQKEDSVRADWSKLKCPYCGKRQATSYWGDDPLPICDVCLKEKRQEATGQAGHPGTCLLSKQTDPGTDT
jgi:transposase